MAIAATFTEARRIAQTGVSRWSPMYLKDRFIFTQNQFPILSLIPASMPEAAPGQPALKQKGAQIKSMVSRSLYPKILDWTKIPVAWETDGTASGLSAGSTFTISLSSVSGLQERSLIKNRNTGATFWVSSISGTTLTCYPHAGGTSGDGTDDIASGDPLDYLGSLWPDGATMTTGINQEPVEYGNYMQFQVTPVSHGILSERIDLQPAGTNGLAEDLKSNMIQHAEGRERALLFGVQQDVETNSERLRSMDGFEGVSSSEYDAGGSVTMDEMRQVIMPQVAAAGGGNIMSVQGNSVLGVWDSIMDGKVQAKMDDTKLGPAVSAIHTPVGDVKLLGSQSMQSRDGEAFFFRPELITRLYLEGLDMVVLEDMGPQNTLGETKAILTCETYLYHNSESIVKVTNLFN